MSGETSGLLAKSILFFLVVGGAGGIRAQVVPTEPTAGAAGPDQPTYTLNTSVRRVFVDVVVTDTKDHVVKGLTKDDFQVFEDGVLQPVRGFDVHVAAKPEDVKPVPKLDLPPNTFANLVRAPEDQPVTVILYDVLNTPLDSLPYAHDAMVKFIKEQKSSSRIAIFVLGDSLRMLQGFTDDETRLLDALNSKAAGSRVSGALQTTSDVAAANDAITADLPVGTPNILADLHTLEATEATYLQQQRLEVTVNAFAQIARFVSVLPGRKNLIWLSGAFPSAVLPNSDPTANGTVNEFADSYSLGDEVKEAMDLLNLNHVSVYPVDARGLQVNPQFSASSNAKGAQLQKLGTFNDQQGMEHATMDNVAEGTGGRAFYNTNGLKQAMQSALDEGATYYTLTYAPTNGKIDGTIRKITVKTRVPNVNLSYRRSYFADAMVGNVPAPPTGPKPLAEEDMFLDAGMQHGSPISSELFLEASVVPVGETMTASDREMESLSEFLATKVKKHNRAPTPPVPLKVQHYEVSYAILGRQLKLPALADGKYATDMSFALAAYTPDSLIVNGLDIHIKNEIAQAQYEKIKTQGYHASMVFVVPVTATSLRIAARDGIGNRMGTIEVPLPIAAPKAAAATAAAPAKTE